MQKFCFDPHACNPAEAHVMKTADAVTYAKTLPGFGYVWQLNPQRKHWAAVGCYENGRAWNGWHRIVPADPGDWDAICREAK